MKQIKIIAIILIALGLSACVTTPPPAIKPPITWAPKHATPEVQLIFQKKKQTKVKGKLVTIYSMNVTSLSKNKTYYLWQKWLDGKVALFSQLKLDGTRVVLEFSNPEKKLPINKKIPLSKITFSFQQMFRGEPIKFTLVSSDIKQSEKAFAHFVPFPLKTKGDSGCSFSMELLSPKGRLFGIIGKGFKPNEEITTLSRSANEVLKGVQNASIEGLFATIIDPGANGSTGGTASFQASGEDCKTILTYERGTAMKRP